MPRLNLRPWTESLLRAWKSMVQKAATGVGYDLAQPSREVFCGRAESALDGYNMNKELIRGVPYIWKNHKEKYKWNLDT